MAEQYTPTPRLPSPRTAYSENASMRGNGGQVPHPLKGEGLGGGETDTYCNVT